MSVDLQKLKYGDSWPLYCIVESSFSTENTFLQRIPEGRSECASRDSSSVALRPRWVPWRPVPTSQSADTHKIPHCLQNIPGDCDVVLHTGTLWSNEHNVQYLQAKCQWNVRFAKDAADGLTTLSASQIIVSHNNLPWNHVRKGKLDNRERAGADTWKQMSNLWATIEDKWILDAGV